MRTTMILGTIAASVWLGTMTHGFAASDEDILIAGQTSFDGLQYDPQANLLVVRGWEKDDQIEVALADDGNVLINGIALARLGLRVEGTPQVAIYGGGGNDLLIARRLPSAIINGGDGEDVLVWQNSDGELDRAILGMDLLMWNPGDKQAAFGGAGIDVLIGNTGGDRDPSIGGLGQDDIIGGTSWDSLYDGWGDDLLLGDDVKSDNR